MGRSFPRLVGATHEGLWMQQYRCATLLVDEEPEELDVAQMTLSPRCQCASMQTKRANQIGPCAVRKGECLEAKAPLHCPGRRQLILFHMRKRDKNGADVMREAPLQVLVPEWVSHSCYRIGEGVSDVREERGPHDIMPRFLRWTETTVPAALQGESRFLRRPAPCRCRVPPRLPNRLKALRQAARSCHACIELLRRNLDLYFGCWEQPGAKQNATGGSKRHQKDHRLSLIHI